MSERPEERLRERLEARRCDIERAILTRVYAIADPVKVGDTYVDGLRAAVSASIDYAIETVGHRKRRLPPTPAPLLVQARIAARNRVDLDTVLRRYFAGYSLFVDFLVEEAGRDGLLVGGPLKEQLRFGATAFDNLLAEVAEEHAREDDARAATGEKRRAKIVRGLLAGELVDSSELAYDLDMHHLGLAVSAPDAPAALRALAETLDRRLLLVESDEQETWAWLGGHRGFGPDDLRSIRSLDWTSGHMAVGEAGEGLTGWRLTHRQAVAALQVAQKRTEPVVFYADVAVIASILRDDLLGASLRQLYLQPLERVRDGGRLVRETLRTYFAADRNVSAAAASLGVSRQTAAKRLRVAEEALGRPLGSCAPELELALRLMELDSADE